MRIETGVRHLQQSDDLAVHIDERTARGIVGGVHAEDVVAVFVHEFLNILHFRGNYLGRFHGVGDKPGILLVGGGHVSNVGGSGLAVDPETDDVV